MGAGDYLATHQYLETQFKIIQSKREACCFFMTLVPVHRPKVKCRTRGLPCGIWYQMDMGAKGLEPLTPRM